MKENLQLFLIAIFGFVLLSGIYYAEHLNDKKENFVSFNDGSIDCITLKVPAKPTKEQLAQVLIQGHDTLLGKTGDTVGCVNYEFS
jgi:hypothetical protein